MSRMPPINRRLFRAVDSKKTGILPPPQPKSDTTIERARYLRAVATPAERVLWAVLRDLRPQAFHFRRQSPVGPYIEHFACKRFKIVVELDGSHHGEDAHLGRDAVRTAFIAAHGYRVLRFWNHDVFENRDGVVDTILRALGPTRPASPDDLPVPGR